MLIRGTLIENTLKTPLLPLKETVSVMSMSNNAPYFGSAPDIRYRISPAHDVQKVINPSMNKCFAKANTNLSTFLFVPNNKVS